VAYNEELEGRIRRAVADREGITDKKMFGGVAFLLDGKMFVGIVKDDLMVRVGPEAHEKALCESHVRPMDFAGRPMKGYVYVGPAGSKTDKMVAKWVERGLKFVATVGNSKKGGKKK
jgi:TfoX/Sxy family transcriptional regulator of competence genes